MGTTDLFVELIVIGIGAFAWIAIATLSIFGYQWVPLEKLLSVSAIVPFLSFVYIVGIVTDRLADVLFDQIWIPRLQRKHHYSLQTAREDRRLIYSKNEYLANLIEYGRSRLRICRGWAFNSVLIMIASSFFVATQVADAFLRTRLFIWINLLFGFIAFFSWYSWYQLSDTQYYRVKDDANFARESEGLKKRRTK